MATARQPNESLTPFILTMYMLRILLQQHPYVMSLLVGQSQLLESLQNKSPIEIAQSILYKLLFYFIVTY